MASVEPNGSETARPSWIWDPAARRIDWANAAAADLLGAASPQELTGRVFLSEDPLARAMDDLHAALRGSEGTPPDEERTPADASVLARLFAFGALRTLWVSGAPAALGDGRIGLRAVVGLRGDGAAPPFEPLYDVAPTALVLLDGENRVLTATAEARALGMAPGAPLTDAFADPDLVLAGLDAVRAEGALTVAAVATTPAGPVRGHLVARAADRGPGAPVAAVFTPALESRAAAPVGVGAGVDVSVDVSVLEPNDVLLDRPPFGLALVDPATQEVRRWSASARSLLGFPEDAAPSGWTLPRLFPAEAARLRSLSQSVLDDPEKTARISVSRARGDGAEPLTALAILAARTDPPPIAIELWLVDIEPERTALDAFAQERVDRRAALALVEAGAGKVAESGTILELDPAVGAATGWVAGGSMLDALAESDQRALRAALTGPDAVVLGALRLTGGAAARVALGPKTSPDAHSRRFSVARVELPPAPNSAPEAHPGAASGARPGGRDISPAMSHAVRTALTTIRGFAELMLDDDGEPPRPRQSVYLDDIVDCAVDLTRLVDRAGAWPSAQRTMDGLDRATLGAVLRQALAEPLTTPSGVSITIETVLDGAVEAVETWMDAGDTRELLELAAVALAAAPADGAADITLALRASRSDRAPLLLEIECRDAVSADAIAAEPVRAIALRAASLIAEKRGGRMQTPSDGVLHISLEPA